MSRYNAESADSQFEPGSRGRVLRNRLGVVSAREMARLESEALLLTTEQLIEDTAPDRRFKASDIRRMHRQWLGAVYPWAGRYRNVNIAKGDFMFAAATRIPQLMQVFERGPLRAYTPGNATGGTEQAEALAVVHAELILIHPFRDGNGRCCRLLSTLMALQMGLPPLDFGGLSGRGKRRYIEAIHASMRGDYGPMRDVMQRTIERSIRSYEKAAAG